MLCLTGRFRGRKFRQVHSWSTDMASRLGAYITSAGFGVAGAPETVHSTKQLTAHADLRLLYKRRMHPHMVHSIHMYSLNNSYWIRLGEIRQPIKVRRKTAMVSGEDSPSKTNPMKQIRFYTCTKCR